MVLLQEDVPSHPLDPYHNELPETENELFQKRVPDLPRRVRRHPIWGRRRREALPKGGRFRGQTQSQYLAVNPGKEGKAEAEATQQSSRAIVSE